MKTHTYLTNLTDAAVGPARTALSSGTHTGHPRQHSLRTIVNALLYVLRTGCAWRLLPADWPAGQSVYYYLQKMAPGWHLGADPHDPAGAAPGGIPVCTCACPSMCICCSCRRIPQSCSQPMLGWLLSNEALVKGVLFRH